MVIEETVSDEFTLTAESKEEAVRMVELKYKNGEYVISPGSVTAKKFALIKPDCESTEWIDF